MKLVKTINDKNSNTKILFFKWLKNSFIYARLFNKKI
jgi:hypothetical protein